MPKQQSYGQSVNVFHFTSKISNAKIKKYKQATERGMGPGGATPDQPSQPDARSPSMCATPAPQSGTGDMEPPKKKLKLNGPRVPMNMSEGDTIAVSQPVRPNRDGSLRIRYSEDMVIPPEDLARKPKPSPAASSDLSSLSSAPSVPPAPPAQEVKEPVKEVVEIKEEPSKQDPTPTPARPTSSRQDYGDFMSWYVQGGDEEEPEAAPEPEPVKASEPSKQQPQSPAQAPPQSLSQQTSQSHLHYEPHVPPMGVPGYIPPPQPQPQMIYRAPPPPPPQPVYVPPPQPVQTIEEPRKPTNPDSHTVMKKKVLALSTALTNFGGVPPVPKSPGAEAEEEKKAKEGKGKEVKARKAKRGRPSQADNLLALFDAADSDSELSDLTESEDEDKDEVVDDEPMQVGYLDSALTYGIEFIMNALRSWGQAKMQQDRMRQQQQHHQQVQAKSQPGSQKRGPGRPRKFPNEASPPAAPPPFGPLKLDITGTPEGRAVDAFQAVLDSGVLQVNTIYPADLSRALRHLYMQIDHLINQGAKQPARWTCMSYSAQIHAHKQRVEQAKVEIAQFESEVARQKHSSQQQIMQQMGIRVPQPGENSVQAQRINEMELERRRSLAQAQQQPFIAQQHLNPLLLNSQPSGTPQGYAPSPSPANASQAGPSAGRPSSATAPNGQPEHSNGVPQVHRNNSGAVGLEKISMYMPAENMPLGRSGQSMKFSFEPSEPMREMVRQAFGSQAVPSPNGSSQDHTANRGPVAESSLQTTSPVAGPSNHAADSKSVEVKTERPDSREGSAGQQSNGHGHAGTVAPKVPISTDDAIANDIAHKTNGFTAVNGSSHPASAVQSPTKAPVKSANGKARSMSAASAAGSPTLGSSAATVSKLNGSGYGVDLASRFPHPGAVVVDQ